MKSVEPEDAGGAGNPGGSEELGASATESVLDRSERDDEYLDRATEWLIYDYDLQREYAARGERFDLFGSIRMEGQKQLLHRSISYANHHVMEYIFARRVDATAAAELEQLVGLGHALADEWIEPDEEHYGAEFMSVLITDAVPEEIQAFMSDLVDRTLLKFGHYGHYEVSLTVVAPGDEDAAVSRNADSAAAFMLRSDSPPAVADGLLG